MHATGNRKRLIKVNNVLLNYMSRIKWASRTITLGMKNRDKTFMIIRRNSKTVGLFSYVLTNLGYIKNAVDNGYIPVIDMKNYESPYRDIHSKCNVWEYYFEQPMNYNLDDVKHSYKVMLTSGEIPESFPGLELLKSEEEIVKWREIYHKYIRLNRNTQIYVNDIKESLIGEYRVLGVLCRGTDYRSLKPKLHPVQPDVDVVIADTKAAMEKWNCEKVYLATEDIEILQKFKNVFKEKLIFPDFSLRQYNETQLISTIEIDRKDDRRLKGLEYLTQIALLAQCNCFIGSGCGGTYAALLMSNGFEHYRLYDLGVY